MFEAIVTLCLTGTEPVCRDVLLPGYEAHSQNRCESALHATPPELGVFSDFTLQSGPACKPAAEQLEVEEIAAGVFVYTGAIEEPNAQNRGAVSNLGFIIGESSVAVIDSGSARWMGEATWRAIRARTDKPVSHIILTHTHPDHVLGASVFAAAGAEVVGHAALPRALSDRRLNYLESLERLIGAQAFLGTRTSAIDRNITQNTQIDLGSRTLQLQAWPLAHTGTDLTVFDENTGTLFAGDLVFHRHTPALDGSVRGWQNVMKQLSEENTASRIKHVVPGHGAASLPWPDSAQNMQRYLDVLANDTRKAIDKGERLAEAVTHIAKSEQDNWALFDAYNPRNATVAYTELEWE